MSKIALVEQDGPLVRLMAWYLVEAGFEVSVIARADDVIPRLKTDPPDLLVCNSAIATSQRRAFFADWKALCPHLAIIDVWPTHAVADATPDTGADAYMHLPFHADALIETARSLLS